MHKYKIYDTDFKDGFKREWFTPKDIETFYDKNQKSFIYETEKLYLEVFNCFANTSFSVCELEKYHEYYGINQMKEIYSAEYSSELLDIYENIKEDFTYSVQQAENIFKLTFRGHIWCILKFDDGTEIFFEKPGILIISTAKEYTSDSNRTLTVENII